MLTQKHFTRRLANSTNSLPRAQECGLGTQEYDSRRAEAEHGSQRLAAAIQRYFERRAG